MGRTRNSLQLGWAHTTWRGVDAPCSHLLLPSLPAFVSSRCHCAVHPSFPSNPLVFVSPMHESEDSFSIPSHSLPPSLRREQAGRSSVGGREGVIGCGLFRSGTDRWISTVLVLEGGKERARIDERDGEDGEHGETDELEPCRNDPEERQETRRNGGSEPVQDGWRYVLGKPPKETE